EPIPPLIDSKNLAHSDKQMPHNNVKASNSQQPSVPQHSSSTSGLLPTTSVHQPNYQDLFLSSGWMGNNPNSLPFK
ncbi:4311_t:CDS:1, partial [Gigaspora margarita]